MFKKNIKEEQEHILELMQFMFDSTRHTERDGNKFYTLFCRPIKVKFREDNWIVEINKTLYTKEEIYSTSLSGIIRKELEKAFDPENMFEEKFIELKVNWHILIKNRFFAKIKTLFQKYWNILTESFRLK